MAVRGKLDPRATAERAPGWSTQWMGGLDGPSQKSNPGHPARSLVTMLTEILRLASLKCWDYALQLRRVEKLTHLWRCNVIPVIALTTQHGSRRAFARRAAGFIRSTLTLWRWLLRRVKEKEGKPFVVRPCGHSQGLYIPRIDQSRQITPYYWSHV
jgi:hypothetical protein